MASVTDYIGTPYLTRLVPQRGDSRPSMHRSSPPGQTATCKCRVRPAPLSSSRPAPAKRPASSLVLSQPPAGAFALAIAVLARAARVARDGKPGRRSGARGVSEEPHPMRPGAGAGAPRAGNHGRRARRACARVPGCANHAGGTGAGYCRNCNALRGPGASIIFEWSPSDDATSQCRLAALFRLCAS